MLLPARMKKIVVIGFNDDRDRVLSVLHDLKTVQVEPVSKGLSPYFSAEKGAQLEHAVATEAQRFKTLVTALPPVPVTERSHFPSTQALLEATKRVTIDERVHQLKRKEDELITRQENLRDVQKVLEEFTFFNEDLSILLARSIFSFFTTVEREHYPEFEREVRFLSKDAYLSPPQTSEDRKHVRLVVIVPRENAEAFARLTSRLGARLYAIPSEFRGTPRVALGQIAQRLEETGRELELIRSALMEIAREWYPKVLPIEEELLIEARKAEVAGRLGRSRSSFALEGWIPTKELPRLRAALQQATGNRHQLIETDEHEGAPTLLRNPTGFNIYEFFIRFYSLPQNSEIDPTLVFALIFPFFFGFMLGDVGYSAFILTVCVWLIWRIGNPKAGPTWTPKFLRKFVTQIVPPHALKQLAKTFVPGCIVGIAFGIAFDSYFGFSLSQLTMGHFDFYLIPPHNGIPGQVVYVAKLLLASVYIGLGMVTLGLIFGAINQYFHHNVKHVLGKICWMLVAWGITLLGLSLVHHYPGSWLIAYSQYFDIYLALLIVGALGVVATEGALSAIELPSIMSHVLSYARLVGILLASVILAYVINAIAVLGTSSGPGVISHGIGYAVVAIVLVAIGAVFNILIGVIEPGIQGVRLLYVEHFSKFYTGNGRPFTPFGVNRKYTKPQLLESHPELGGHP